MLKKILWRTALVYKAQFISMIIMVALGLGMFAGFNMEWVSIDENSGDFYKKTGFADYRLIDEEGFSKENLEAISKIEGVEKASRYFSVNVVSSKDSDIISISVTENPEVTGFMVMKGEAYDAESTEGLWIGDKYAKANGYKLGDEIALTYQGMEIRGIVKGLVKSSEYLICTPDETQIMPDFKKYGYAYISPVFLEKIIGRDYYTQIHIISDVKKNVISEKANAALGKTTLLITKDEVVSYKETMGEKEEGQTMAAILPVVFLVIALLTMVTTMHRITAAEKTQIGTLKALGFKDRQILIHYTTYAIVIGVFGAVAGLIMGYGVCRLVMNPHGAMGTYLDMPSWKMRVPVFVWATLIGMIGLLAFIGFMSVKNMLKGTAADALRAYTPKKMRKLWIEKFGIWNKFKFGTKWNLRDIMRHKSRSAMTILGVFGCIVIILACLGLNDTFDLYIDKALHGCYNFKNTINLTKETDNEQALALAEKYDADWCATSSIEENGKAVSLQVMCVNHDYMRFIDPDGEYIKLSDDGAYICKRIAEANKLKKGDNFSFSPFGTDLHYEVKVAGVISSMTEGIVITKNYAEQVGIDYSINQLYTNESEIESSSFIENTQEASVIYDAMLQFMGVFYTMIILLVFVAIVLGVVVLYNLGVMSYVERYKEMATLKVVGFKDKGIKSLLISQNLWITVVGVLIGIPAGVGLLYYLMDALGGDYELVIKISPLSYIISIALVFGTSYVVALMIARKNRKINMVEALKRDE